MSRRKVIKPLLILGKHLCKHLGKKSQILENFSNLHHQPLVTGNYQ